MLQPLLADSRFDHLRAVAAQRRFDLCTVIEVPCVHPAVNRTFIAKGVHVAGNVSAIKRSADAFGLQSLHVIGAPSSIIGASMP